MDQRTTRWPTASRPTAPTCARWPTGCSARPSEADDAVQEAWLRLSRADADDDREPRRLADDRRRARLPRHAALAQVAPRGAHRPAPARADREPRGRGRPRARGAARRLGRPRAARRARDARAPPSGSPSCCTTCSPCRSTRSPRSSGAPPPPRASSRAARAAGCGARRRRPTPISPASARWSTPSSPPPRGGDFDALVAVLDPDVVLRVDRGALRARRLARGPRRGRRGRAGCAASRRLAALRAAGARQRGGRVRRRAGADAPLAVIGFTVAHGRIVEIDVLADPDRLRELDLSALAD